MKPKLALQIVLVIGLLGLLFSGFLSYQELFATCAVSCPIVKAPGSVIGLPACVYGFFLYLSVVLVAGLGLRKK